MTKLKFKDDSFPNDYLNWNWSTIVYSQKQNCS